MDVIGPGLSLKRPIGRFDLGTGAVLWLLITSFWNDNGVWSDDASWSD